jgi:hypothetical protein
MLYREIIADCSQIHTKQTNTPCGQNVELLNVKLVVHIVTSGQSWPNTSHTLLAHSSILPRSHMQQLLYRTA